MPAELHFLRPLWFLALLPLGLILLRHWRVRSGADAWRRLVDPHLLPHLLAGSTAQARRWPLALLGLAWLLGVTALAGPVWERLPQPVFATTAKRVILLDLSPSMNAADLTPSRLARARYEVLDLLAATHEGQVGLIAFGPEPFVVSPLSGDARTIADQVPRLATDLLPVPGPRRPERALALAGELLAQAGAGGGEVILITDGVGGTAGGGAGPGTPANAAARDLAAAGHRLSVLGVGTPAGAPVPGPDGGFASAGSGAIPLARLNRGDLESLARAGGGRYVDLDAGDRDTLALIAPDPMAAATTGGAQSGLASDQWQEEGPWLLLVLLPAAALGFRRGWLVSVVALPLVLPLLALVSSAPASALGWEDLWLRPDQQGASRLAAGDGAAAAERFADPAWRAAAHYRAGDPTRALADLEGLQGPEADYNRGNALARLGRLDEAIGAYERALATAPDHADARANLELLKRLRDQQQPDQQQPDQQQPDQQKGNQQPGEQQQGDRKGQGQAAQQGQGQEADPSSQNDKGPGNAPQQGADQAGSRAPGPQDSGTRRDPGAAGQPQDADTPGREPGGKPNAGAPPSGRDPAAAPADAGRAGGRSQPGSKTPSGADLGAGAQGPSEIALPKDPEPQTDATSPGGAKQPAGTARTGTGAHPPGAADLTPPQTPEQRERQQAMEAQLRAVPDDPAGLLRQRFLLQQLRREGRLP